MGKERAYSAKLSITSGESETDGGHHSRGLTSSSAWGLVAAHGAASHQPHAHSFRLMGAVSPQTPHKAIGPNSV